MRKYALFFLIISILPYCSFAQVFPEEGASLHYRIVGFRFPASLQAKSYSVEVASGSYFNEDSFKRHIIVTVAGNDNRVIAEVPYFGASYTWRVNYVGTDAAHSSKLRHFSTGIVPAIDSLTTRVRVLKPAEKFKDAFVFMDGNKVLYDMAGKPVWYMPAKDEQLNVSLPLRDLKLSHRGTITFMSGQPDGEQIYEMDYDGRILWKGPNDGRVSGEPAEYYHHQFSRLSNGHYMVLGNEFLWSSVDSGVSADTNMLVIKNPRGKQVDHVYVKVPLVTIIEYDENSNVVWKWRSSDYFLHSDVRYRRQRSNGTFDDVHGNGFFFDQQKQNIYISFRDISRILKVHYPDGKVVAEYGKTYKPGDLSEPGSRDTGNGYYCYQHYCIPSEGGGLYVFNNNSCNPAAGPTIVKLREPDESGGQLTKIWEYACQVETPFQNKDFSFHSGGDIAELPDKCLFINMGGMHSRLSIITEDKKLLWSAIAEQLSDNGSWTAISQYRSSIIFRNDLERLILGNSAKTPAADGVMITYNSNK